MYIIRIYVQYTARVLHHTTYDVQRTAYDVQYKNVYFTYVCTVYSASDTVHYTVHCTYDVQCTLYSAYIVQCTPHTVHFTVYSIRLALYVWCTLYSAYTVHCTFYNPQITPHYLTCHRTVHIRSPTTPITLKNPTISNMSSEQSVQGAPPKPNTLHNYHNPIPPQNAT